MPIQDADMDADPAPLQLPTFAALTTFPAYGPHRGQPGPASSGDTSSLMDLSADLGRMIDASAREEDMVRPVVRYEANVREHMCTYDVCFGDEFVPQFKANLTRI